MFQMDFLAKVTKKFLTLKADASQLIIKIGPYYSTLLFFLVQPS